MGFRYRKSINLGGGFRINLSKSGVGYSWGTKGYRVTKLANGRTRRTASIPGTGLSHVTETTGKRNKNNFDVNSQSDILDTKIFENGEITKFRSSEYIELINAIEKAIQKDKRINILIIIGFVLFVVPPLGLLWFLLSVIYKMYNRKNNKILIEYQMDEYSNAKYIKKMSSWKNLSMCNSIWIVNSESKVANSRKHSGANSIVSREKISLSNKIPFYLSINITIYSLINKKETILFMPDKIMIIRKNKIGVISYEDIDITMEKTRMIEKGNVPKDTKVLETVWEHANKNGSRDKRYKNNRQLPVCEYAEIHFKSESGINIMLMVSNYNIAKKFVDGFINEVTVQDENR